ncbi:MAG: hypothetical protein RBU23_06130 [Candidatus Auribacterota bacterium]|nr:hypothetical protein [Candidatus Auribacterota bacterium]
MNEERKDLFQKFEIKDIVRAIFKRKVLFMIGFMAVTPMVFPVILGLPNLYSSKTVILIRDKRNVKVLQQQGDISTPMKERIRTFTSEIKSWNNITRAMDAVGVSDLAQTPLEMEMLVNQMRNNLSISRAGSTDRTDILTLTFVHRDPVTTQRFLNVITNNFIEKSLKDQRVEIFSSINFIKEQIAKYEELLKESQAKLVAFKRNHMFDVPNPTVSPSTILTLNQRKTDIDFTIEQELQEQKYLADQIAILEETDGAKKERSEYEVDPVLSELERKMQRLKTSLENMEMIYTDEHPDIIETKRLIIATQSKIDERKGQLKEKEILVENTALRDLRYRKGKVDLRIAILGHRKRQIESELQNVREKLDELPSITDRYAYLVHENKALKRVYYSLLEKLEAAKMTQHIDQTEQGLTFEMLEPARLPLKPFKPNRWRILLMGMMAGLAVGAGLAFIVEFADHSFRGTEDARNNLPIPVIGVIPSIVTARERRRKRIKNFLFGCLSVMYLIGLGVVSVYVYKYYH